MSNWTPNNPPVTDDVRVLTQWIVEQLERLEPIVNQTRLQKLYVAPTKLRDGLIVYADGTSWNPGSGEGVYARENGAWVKL